MKISLQVKLGFGWKVLFKSKIVGFDPKTIHRGPREDVNERGEFAD